MNNDSSITLESMSKAGWYNKWLLGQFREFLSGDILEVGCGIGNFTDLLTQFGNVWAVDINSEYLKKTEDRFGGKVKVGFGDIEKAKYFLKNQRFECIVCLNVLEHIKDDSKALNNLFKLLKPQGVLILLLPAHQFLYGEIDKSIGHFRRYDKSGIRKKLEKIGFKIIKSKRLNFLGAFGWFIVGRVLKQKTVQEGNIKIFNLIAPLFLQIEKFVEPPIGTSILIIAQK